MSYLYADRRNDELARKARAERKTPRIVILTGAGISAESGISTFRDVNGLWEQHRIEDVASPRAYAANPDMVHRFYDARRAQLHAVQPNAAHLALARLEGVLPGEVLIVTQNVDDLHEKAASGDVIHMHGQLRSALCTSCGHRAQHYGDLRGRPACTKCGAQSLRPDIVWFGEQIREGERIYEAVENCEVFVVIGTSGNVHPAAGLVDIAKANRARTVLIDLDPHGRQDAYDHVYPGVASTSVAAWVRDFLLAEGGLSRRMVEQAIERFLYEARFDDEDDQFDSQYRSLVGARGEVDTLLMSLAIKFPEHHPARYELDPILKQLRGEGGQSGEGGFKTLVAHMLEHHARTASLKDELRRTNMEYAVDLIAWIAADQARGVNRS